MSDEQKSKPTSSTSGEKMASPAPLIPVKSITFLNGMVVDLPGKSTCSGLTATAERTGNQQAWRISYDPRLRHHKVEFFKPGKDVPQVRYIPDHWCSWEPV